MSIIWIVLALSVVGNAIQQYRVMSLQKDVVVLENTLFERNQQIGILRQNVETCKQTCLAETESLQKLTEELTRNQRTEQDALDELRELEREFNAEQEKENGDTSNVASPSDKLPASTTRVLNDLCNRIQGSPCASP